MTSHTILLLQPSRSVKSRTWSDYDTLSLCIEGILRMFETSLQEKLPNKTHITYDVKQIYNFLDQLGEVNALVFSDSQQAYIPHNVVWLKEKIFSHLKKIAS
eukprot:Sdes_comp9385_c0_seq1m845